MADAPRDNTFTEFTSLVQQINEMVSSAAISKTTRELKEWQRAVNSLASEELSRKLLRNEEQRRRARELGEADLFATQVKYQAKLMSLEDRMSIAKRQSNTKQLNQLQKEATSLEEQLEFIGKQYEIINQVVGSSEKLVNMDEMRVKNAVELAGLEATMQQNNAVNIDRQLERKKELLVQEQKMLMVADAQEKVEERRNKIAEAADKLFGITMEDMKAKAKDLELVLTNPFVLIGTAITYAAVQIDRFRKETGAAFSQSGTLVKLVGGGLLASLKQGIIASPGEATAATGELAQQYGRMDIISNDLVANQLKLTSLYGLSGEEAAELLHQIDFLSDRSKGAATNAISFARALARANQIPVGQLLKDMADHAELMARFGEQGVTAFIRVAAEARKMGVDLGKIDDVANRILDPENFMQGVMRIRSMLGPGVLSNPIKLMQLANDPTKTDQLMREMARQLGPALPRVQHSRILQNVLTEGFGLDLDTMQRLVHGERIAGAGLVNPLTKDFEGEKLDNILGSLDNVSDILKRILEGVGIIAALMLGKGLLGKVGGSVGGILGGLGVGGILGRIKGLLKFGGGGAEAAEGLGALGVGEEVAAGAGAVAGVATMGSIVAVGAALLGGGILAAKLLHHKHAALEHAGMTDKDKGLPMSVTTDVNTDGIENRLDALIQLFENGVDLKLDGRKVGNFIVNSYPR